jgi:hypothetical protein
MGGPFGQVFETKLCYTVQIQLDPASGGSTSSIFRANGLHDPEVATGGHRPHGFNEISAIFKNYQVMSSSTEAILFPKSDSYTWPATVSGTQTSFVVPQLLLGSCLAVAVRDTTTSLTGAFMSATTILERPNVKSPYGVMPEKKTALQHAAENARHGKASQDKAGKEKRKGGRKLLIHLSLYNL